MELVDEVVFVLYMVVMVGVVWVVESFVEVFINNICGIEIVFSLVVKKCKCILVVLILEVYGKNDVD